MTPFRFRGARLLEWRRVQEETARVAFVRATESARETAAASADADARSACAARECESALRTAIDAGTLERHRIWIDREQRHANTCRRSHEQRLGAVAAAVVVLQDAVRQVRMMERLRDRAWRRHMEASRRAESKALDELATVQFARRMSEGGMDRDH